MVEKRNWTSDRFTSITHIGEILNYQFRMDQFAHMGDLANEPLNEAVARLHAQIAFAMMYLVRRRARKTNFSLIRNMFNPGTLLDIHDLPPLSQGGQLLYQIFRMKLRADWMISRVNRRTLGG